MKTSDKQIFSGGDQLTGIEKEVHLLLMKTELNNGRGGYEISWAGTPSSGISLGGSQTDLSTESAADGSKSQLFEAILNNAIDNNILSYAQRKSITPSIYQQKGKSPEQVFGSLLPKINEAVYASKDIVDQYYRMDLKKKVHHVQRLISELNNQKNKIALEASPEMVIRLVDYHNQFNFSRNGKMQQFLEGDVVSLTQYEPEEVALKAGGRSRKDLIKGVVHVQVPGTVRPEDIVDFIRATDQANQSEHSSRAQETRIKKIDEYFGKKYAPPPKEREHSTKLIRGKIEVGDPRYRSIRSDGGRWDIGVGLSVDLKRLVRCVAYIAFDDHARLVVNGQIVFRSINDGGNDFVVQRIDGVNYVLTGVSKVKAETCRTATATIDLLPHLVNGSNSIVLEVIVEDLGNRHMVIEYENKISARL